MKWDYKRKQHKCSKSPDSACEENRVLWYNGNTSPQIVQWYIGYICTANQDLPMFHINQSEQSINKQLLPWTWQANDTCRKKEMLVTSNIRLHFYLITLTTELHRV
jgi:hypothetical protein